MFCTQCGNELRMQDSFCPNCGHNIRPESATRGQSRLTRDSRNKKIAGVCAGFARYFGVDVVLMRIIFLALAFYGGVGLIVYVVAWIVMPKDAQLDRFPASSGQPAAAR